MKKLSSVREKLKWQKHFAILLFTFLALTANLKAQVVSGYTFAQSNGTYTPITGGTNMVLSSTATAGFDSQFFHNGTDGLNGTTTAGTYNAFPLGFNFNYRGASYNGFYIGTDGWIMLGSTTGSTIAGAGGIPISSTTANTGDIISAFGIDLSGSLRATAATRTSGSPTLTLTGTNTAMASNITVGMRVVGTAIPTGTTVTTVSGSAITMSASATTSSTSATAFFVDPDNISYSISGTAGSQVLTVQWKNVQRWAGGGDVLNFQIKLYEGTNAIQMVYNNTASSQVTTASTVQVGLKGANAPVDFINRTGTGATAWSASTAGTANNSSLPFQGAAATGGAIIPASGLTYSWTPPPVCSGVPTPGTVAPASQTLVAGQPSASLLLSGFSSGVVGLTFQWQESADNSTWTNVTTGTGATTALYTPPTFVGTPIYYRCVVTCTGSGQTANSNSALVTPCTQSVSFTENFDALTTPALPTCWTKVGTTGSAYTQAGTIASSPNVLYIYSSSATAIAMISMPPVSTLQSGSYRLRFKARSNSTVGGIIQVGYLTNPADQATFTSLGSFTTTSTTVADNFILNNITAPAGITTLAFRHTGTPANSVLIDDVVYELTPTCFEPTAVTVSAITPSGASVSWTAPTPAPANGYEVYYSTTNTAPTSSTVLNTTNSVTSATTSAPITGLLPVTKYYVWVRSACIGADRSVWTAVAVSFTTLCQPPALLSTTGASFCPGSTATLTATAPTGAIISWYAASTGGTALNTGNSFTTPSLAATTTYYASAKTDGVNGTVGPVNPSALSSISASNYDIGTYYQIFDVTVQTTLTSIDVFPTSTVAIGTASAIEIRNSAGATLVSVPYTVAVNDGVTPQTVTINYTLPVGTAYRIGQGAGLPLNLNRNTGGATYPFTSTAINVTGNNFSSGPNYWYYIYNWKFVSACESARQAVVATADANACLGTSETGLKNEITLYPNPFTDVLNISESKNVRNVSIVDISGRLVKTIEKPGSALHLADLKSGMYVVMLTMTDGSTKTVKVIKK